MPYITQNRREMIKYSIENPGELNYAITQLLIQYIEHKNRGIPAYTLINDILGALEGAKLEFYRRVAAPYEDQKIKENGDVY